MTSRPSWREPSFGQTKGRTMIRKSSAVWRGDALHGTGALTTQSGAFREQPYSFKTRFQSEDGKAGTNPEELLAAAHAGCYAMALSFALGNAGHPPEELNVTATVNLERVGEGFSITSIALEVGARVAGIDPAKFQTIAETAKRECPLSKALAATPITLSAKLI
jgi:osmotically inducible protein OsmC